MIDHHGEHRASAQEIQAEIASAIPDVFLRCKCGAELLEGRPYLSANALIHVYPESCLPLHRFLD
jgi:hypothetical protein